MSEIPKAFHERIVRRAIESALAGGIQKSTREKIMEAITRKEKFILTREREVYIAKRPVGRISITKSQVNFPYEWKVFAKNRYRNCNRKKEVQIATISVNGPGNITWEYSSEETTNVQNCRKMEEAIQQIFTHHFKQSS